MIAAVSFIGWWDWRLWSHLGCSALKEYILLIHTEISLGIERKKIYKQKIKRRHTVSKTEFKCCNIFLGIEITIALNRLPVLVRSVVGGQIQPESGPARPSYSRVIPPPPGKKNKILVDWLDLGTKYMFGFPASGKNGDFSTHKFHN